MESENELMSEAEFYLWLRTLADYIEVKAETGEDAAKILRDKADELQKLKKK